MTTNVNRRRDLRRWRLFYLALGSKSSRQTADGPRILRLQGIESTLILAESVIHF